MNPLEHVREYSNAPKYRCVARELLYPDRAGEKIFERYFAKANISREAFERYRRGYTNHSNNSNEVAVIENNFRYLFERSRPPFRAARFNAETYPALYTAKDIETAKAERKYYVDPLWKFEYAVYSVYVTAHTADLRPWEDCGELTFDGDHRSCQALADSIRHSVDGVSWYSLRGAGSCCAFFSCDGVAAGQVEEEGSWPD